MGQLPKVECLMVVLSPISTCSYPTTLELMIHYNSGHYFFSSANGENYITHSVVVH